MSERNLVISQEGEPDGTRPPTGRRVESVNETENLNALTALGTEETKSEADETEDTSVNTQRVSNERWRSITSLFSPGKVGTRKIAPANKPNVTETTVPIVQPAPRHVPVQPIINYYENNFSTGVPANVKELGLSLIHI